jgi:hypothetical protein
MGIMRPKTRLAYKRRNEKTELNASNISAEKLRDENGEKLKNPPQMALPNEESTSEKE